MTGELLALALACAPAVAPETLAAIVRAESGGDPLAIHVNGGPPVRRPTDAADAAALARAAMAAGHTVDLGLMQVNSANLEALGTTVERLFEPCTNLAAGAAILVEAYGRAVRVHGPGQPALHAALSAYNTGDLTRGLRNGYVARVTGRPAPAAPDPFSAATTVYTRRSP